MSANRRQKSNTPGAASESGDDSRILNERILLLVFESIDWDVKTVCRAAAVSKRLRAMADRLLWRHLCLHRAPRMIETLTDGSLTSRIGGGWPALAKLLFYCCGSQPSRHFKSSQSSAGHFISTSRFSKTSGRSFLAKKCREDLLYVSDPCEHPIAGDKEYHLGIYRGVFRGFSKSKTRGLLNRRRLELEESGRCPYCAARVWSMTEAGLVPKTAATRLGSHDGGVEYFVCVNGHLYGTCFLVPLSSDEGNSDGDDDIDGANGSMGTT